MKVLQEVREKSQNYKKKVLATSEKVIQIYRIKGVYLGVKSWLSMLDNELIPITVPKDDQVITIKDGSDDDPDLSENRFNNNARDASSLKKQAGLIIAAYNEIVSLLRCLKIHVPKLLNSSKIFGIGQSRML